MSITQTIWGWLDCGDFQPPQPRRGSRYGPDDPCWLCGGPTHGIGWPRKVGIPETFTDHALAKCLPSEAVCQPCVALSRSSGWQQFAAQHPGQGYWLTFPTKEGKKPRDFNWLYASHVFTPDRHESPDRPRWRELLLGPPTPPFVFVMAESGKKQLIFKSRLSNSKNRYWLQTDDDMTLLIRRNVVIELFDVFEALYSLGFSKDSIVTGRYHSGQLAKVGLAAWHPLEQAMRPFRTAAPNELRAVAFCAQKHEVETPTSTPLPTPTPTPTAVTSHDEQMSLF